MKFQWAHDHNNGEAEWMRRDLKEWVTDVFEAPAVHLQQGATTDIRRHVRTELENEGWAINVKIDDQYDLTVFAIKDDLAIQIQTGNMSRAPYDLLKLQYLKTTNKIEAAALALPTRAGALALGSNIANAERMRDELILFKHIITIPILLIAFE